MDAAEMKKAVSEIPNFFRLAKELSKFKNPYTVLPFFLFSLMVAMKIHPFIFKVYQGFPPFFSRCVRFFVRFCFALFSELARKVMKKP